jgi:hypothetical protein
MRIIGNEPLYKRNARLALFTNLTGAVLLALSIYTLFSTPDALGRYFLFLLGGMIFVQVGTVFGRWNRRPDLALAHALKSLDDTYTLYNYRSPVAHLLTGPSGAWILLPRHTGGTITYDHNRRRWRSQGVGFFARMGQESIGNPVQEASFEAEVLDRYLQKNWTGGPLQVQAALVFIDEKTQVKVDNAPLPTTSISKVKAAVLKSSDKGKLTKEQLKQLNTGLEQTYNK